MRDEIKRLADQYQFFHWHLAFPEVFRVLTKDEMPENVQAGWSGGFDVVLGNPPWERIKIQENEWFASRRPDIANAANTAQRRRMISALIYEDSALHSAFLDDCRKAEGESHFVRSSGRYPLCGRGDVNTYTIFAENMRLVIGSVGCVGCIVPSGIATDDTTKFFFQDLMESRSLVSLFDFENRRNIFPGVGHGRSKFCLLTLTGALNATKQGAEFVFFAYSTDDLSEEHRHCNLTVEDIVLLNPNSRTCPIFRSKRDFELTKAIYNYVPILVRESSPEENPWNVSFSRMFDMSNDSNLFRTKEQLEVEEYILEGNVFYKDSDRFLPLYEGKMIWHFDHRFGTYDAPKEALAENGKLPELNQWQHADPFILPIPRYWVHQSHLPTLMYDGRTAFLGFRDIVRSTDFRTSIFSIIPLVPFSNTIPCIILSPKFSRELVYLESCTSSFVFDYVTRQKLGGTHMTFSILKQLPVLPPKQYEVTCKWEHRDSLGYWIWPRVLELTYTAWDLEPFAKDRGYNGPPFCWNDERRFLLRCELDAAYFHLYGIERDDVDYIMGTFPIVKRKDEKQFGEYRTKRVILEIYDEMGRAMETGEPFRTRLEPPPADATVAHGPREKMGLEV